MTAAASIRRRSWGAMGSPWEARLVTADVGHAEAVFNVLEDECRRLEAKFSRFSPRSEVARIARAKVGEPILLDVETCELLTPAFAGGAFTEGLFAPFRATSADPSRPPPSFADLDFDPARRTLRKRRDDFEFDFGGVGKGFALEVLADVILGAGIADFLLDAGSSSGLASGIPPDGPAWRIELVDPLDPERAEDWVFPPGEPMGLSVSWLRTPGRPDGTPSDLRGRDGLPATGPQRGWGVLHPSATFAETLSTALVVGTPAECGRMIARLAATGVGAVRELAPSTVRSNHEHGSNEDAK